MEVMTQKNMAREGTFDPYFKQLDVVSEAAVKGDCAGKRKDLNGNSPSDTFNTQS